MGKNQAVRVAVSNHKGGVGKTTTTAHVSSSMAQSGDNVLVVDCDPQGTLSMHFTPTIKSLRRFMDKGVLDISNRSMTISRASGPEMKLDLNQRLPSVYEAFYNRKMMDNIAIRLIAGSQNEYEQYAEMRGFTPGPVEENLIVSTTDGVDIIPANAQMKGLEKVLSGETDAVMRLKGLLDSVSGYDYVFIDTPASIGTVKDGAVIASENVIIPMQGEGTSVEASRQHLEDLEDMERAGSFNLDINVLAIVPNEIRNDGEAENVLNVIRKKIPPNYWTHRQTPKNFDESTLPDKFWTGRVHNDDGSLLEGVPEVLTDFWTEMGCRPLITTKNDYTDRVTPFEIRTRVAIRRAYSQNRTLFDPGFKEECDMKERYDHIASLVRKNGKQQT